MFRNYFKVAFRNLLKHKGYVAINLFGLTLGMTTALLIMFYVWDEFSYDDFNVNATQIYRVNSFNNFNKTDVRSSKTPPPLGETMLREFPEVQAFTVIGISRARGRFQPRVRIRAPCPFTHAGSSVEIKAVSTC